MNGYTKLPMYEKLLQNIMDAVLEEQIKLGYRREKIRLFYPLQSVKNLLEVECNSEELLVYMKEFQRKCREKLGSLEISLIKERFCFLIPEDGVEYVHLNASNKEFLTELIECVVKHGCTIEMLCKVFEKYSDKVICEKIEQGEFDYILYFKDGKPDEYIYCFHFEGEHAVYHRFTKRDYEDFSF